MLEIEKFFSFKPSLTIKFNMCITPHMKKQSIPHQSIYSFNLSLQQPCSYIIN
jgi:hypothetical protein